MKRKYCLAPMAGYTDPAFRVLCGKYGADFAITEMISAEGLIRGNKEETLRLLNGSPPTAAQIFGSNPKSLLQAAILFEKRKFREINFNAGCPVRKVVRKGSGAALLKDPKKLKEIIELLSGSIKKPVSVKIRLGYSSNNSIRISKLLERAGASSIIVHARTASQGYSGEADWKYIQRIKDAVGIPIYGNGDVVEWNDAYRMLEETGCDGVYIGRAAISNPFIFQEIKKKKGIKLDKKKVRKWFLEYYKIRSKNNLTNALKPIAIGACKGFEGAKEMRAKIMHSKNKEEILEIFKL